MSENLDQALNSGWQETKFWLLSRAREPADLSAQQLTRLLAIAGDKPEHLQLLADCIEAKHHPLSAEQRRAILDFVGTDEARIQWLAGWLGEGVELDVPTRVHFISHLLRVDQPGIAAQRAVLHLFGLVPATGDLHEWRAPAVEELGILSHVLAALPADDYVRLEKAIADSATFDKDADGAVERVDYPLRGQLLFALALLQRSDSVPETLKTQLRTVFGASQSVNFSALS